MTIAWRYVRVDVEVVGEKYLVYCWNKSTIEISHDNIKTDSVNAYSGE